MAYNSDGYIMIDFTEVDFRRTNQTIEGLFKRCVDVIGTNKFILVINANGRTPLPATCSFTNNQYVIDTCIYMFAISSNDNLFIRRNDVPASDIIDDSSISVDKTWSSNKIDSELDTKADTSALDDYQPLLTAVSPISIDSSNNISVDLSGKQNVLTAGDNITITGDVISSNQIKKYTYTGNGANTLELPINPDLIINISANITATTVVNITMPYCRGNYYITSERGAFGSSRIYGQHQVTWNNDNIVFSNSRADFLSDCLNKNNIVYTVYYI